VIGPSFEVTVGIPHASVADAAPHALLSCSAVGLQPKVTLAGTLVNTGAVLSSVHVTVVDAVAVLPHASRAVNTLVWEREQPLLVIGPSFEVTVGVPQASVADAAPHALLSCSAVGLQPKVTLAGTLVNTGAVLSAVHVTVVEAVAVLPQASLAVNILV
jgi:hypothetical protein